MSFEFVQDDGGRSAAGFKGRTGDCVARAIAIATGLDYREVYDELSRRQKEFSKGRSRKAKAARGKSSAREGVFREVYQSYLADLGWEWVATMKIGSGCQVHLRPEELGEGRTGRIIARLSKHICAVVDGAIHDTYDPSREGTRCVYGYFREKE